MPTTTHERLRPARRACVVLLLLASCGTLPRMAADAARADAYARSSIELLRTRGLAGLRPRLSANVLADPQLERHFAAMARALPAGTPDSVTLTRANLNDDDGGRDAQLTYVVHTGAAATEVVVWTEEAWRHPHVVGLRVTRIR